MLANIKYKKSLKSKGFTLIELMVVVTVIGILAGIVTMVFAGSQQKARDAKRKSDVRTIYDAASTYAIVNNGRFYNEPNAANALVSDRVQPTYTRYWAMCFFNGSGAAISGPGAIAAGYHSNDVVKGNHAKLERAWSKYLVNGVIPIDPVARCRGGWRPGFNANGYEHYIMYRSGSGEALSIWTQLENTEDPDRNGDHNTSLYRGIHEAGYLGIVKGVAICGDEFIRYKRLLYGVGSPGTIYTSCTSTPQNP